MARAATAAELIKFRTDGQRANRKILIDAPTVIYTARATGAVSQADYSLAFDGASGTLADCLPDMTLLIGSSAGAADVGIARLRKAPAAGIFYIGADPSLVVADDDYLTVIDDFEVCARHPFGIFLDVDDANTDEFTSFAPVPVMGDPAIIDPGDTISFNSSDAWVPGSTISAHAWTFTGASASTGTNTATPTATYNAAGRYRVKYVPTAANGKTNTGYRYVYALGGAIAPDESAVIDEPECDDDGAWTCRVLMYDRPDVVNLRRAIIYTDDRYGETDGAIGPFAGRENITLAGRIIGESIVRAPGQDTVEFTVGNELALMKLLACQQAGLVDTNFPTDDGADLPAWAKMTGLTVQKMIHYLIVHRSTLIRGVDVRFETGIDLTGWACPKLSADSERLAEQLQDIAAHAALTVRSDRYGRIYVERDTQLYPVADRTADIPVVMTLTDADWRDELSVIRRQSGGISSATAEGYLYLNGALTRVGGISPGNQPARYGDVEAIDEVYFGAQADALELAGLMAGAQNQEIEAILVPLAGNIRLIDVAPRQFVNVTVDGTTYRCIPRNVRLREGGGNFMFPALELAPEGGEWPSVALTYQNEGEEPVDEPVEPPDVPPEPPDGPPEEPPEPGEADAVAATSADVETTGDLDVASPDWESELNAGPTAPVDASLAPGSRDVYWALERESLWLTENLSDAGAATWSEKYTAAQFEASFLCTGCIFLRVVCSNENLVDVLAAAKLEGDADYSAWHMRSTNRGATWNVHQVEDAITSKDYTVTHKTGVLEHPVAGAGDTLEIRHTRIGDDDNTYNPWALAVKYEIPEGGAISLSSDANSIHNFDDSTVTEGNVTGTANVLLPAAEEAIAEGWLTDYFGAHSAFGVIGEDMPLAANRVNVRFFTNFGAWSFDAFVQTWVFWNVPSPDMPSAMDVAPTNTSWIYVGFKDKIRATEDGGVTWFDFYTAHGANDLIVDPQLAGAIYYWSSTGTLNLMIKQTLGAAGTINIAAMMTEAPLRAFGRLARDPTSGRLWGIANGTALKVRYLAGVTDLLTTLSAGCGLHVYPGQKMIFVDQSVIYISDDVYSDPPTITDKTGDWADYAAGVQAHRIIAA